ncbi:DUF1592 domain-containing protein [Verrucomicrobiota bacterium sgz303538]
MNLHFVIRRLLLLSLALPLAATVRAQQPEHPGAALYTKLCVDCHGKSGEGVKDEYEEPLTGDRSLEALTKRVKRTMPDDDPGSLTAEEAAQISAYIYDAFYSPAAQARLHPPEIDLARLTVPQYRTVVADLIGRFRGGFPSVPSEERGLKAHYSGFAIERLGPKLPSQEPKDEEERKKQRERAKFERIDRQVALSFGSESPAPEKMLPEEFQIRWDGSVFAEETGTYEFVIKTENGARLWVNDTNKQLIDGWVSAGENVREEKKSIFLIGGRYYPLVLEFFKFKDKTASIQLQWKAPHGVLETIPERLMSPRQVRQTMVVSTNFPADDRSVGYERGTGISKEWNQATTEGAIAVAEHVEENLAELSGAKPETSDRIERLKEFARRFVETAFRRPLTDEQKAFVEAQFTAAKTPELAIKRVVLFTLKSPRFLYADLHESAQPDDYDIASRLALSLWDSLPDEKLLQAAAAGKLRTREEITAHARRMLADGRTKAKLHGFFHHWLELERADSIAKDPQAFPGFDEAVLADLRTSLALFIDQVVWSERSDYRELLQADYLLLNNRLARLYGKGDVGEGFQRVNFDGKQRSGVLTHPYLMTSLAYNKYTSPIHRGVFLTRNVLGLTLKSPPMAVQFEDSRFDPTFTMREKITEMTRDKSCVGCHSVINPLGFALENYDAIGRWRTVDNNKPVDPTAELHTDDAEVVRFSGARDVADLAVNSDRGQRAFIRQLFNHTVKQDAGAYGPDTMDVLLHSFTSTGFNIQKLLTEIVVTAASHGLSAPDPQQLAKK